MADHPTDQRRPADRLALTKAALLSPAERAALEAQYGHVVGQLIDNKLEAKARELLERYRASIQQLLGVALGDTTDRETFLVTRAEAAKLLSVSLSTIKRMEETGELPDPLTFGERNRRHRLVDIERLAKTRALHVVE